eukprot:6298038-Amphidinium_carterae.1
MRTPNRKSAQALLCLRPVLEKYLPGHREAACMRNHQMHTDSRAVFYLSSNLVRLSTAGRRGSDRDPCSAVQLPFCWIAFAVVLVHGNASAARYYEKAEPYIESVKCALKAERWGAEVS